MGENDGGRGVFHVSAHSQGAGLVHGTVKQVWFEVGACHLEAGAPLSAEGTLQVVRVSQGQHALGAHVSTLGYHHQLTSRRLQQLDLLTFPLRVQSSQNSPSYMVSSSATRSPLPCKQCEPQSPAQTEANVQLPHEIPSFCCL